MGKRSRRETRDGEAALGKRRPSGGSSARTPTEEEFVEQVLSADTSADSDEIVAIEESLGLPKGAIVSGSPEHGLLSPEEIIARARARVDKDLSGKE